MADAKQIAQATAGLLREYVARELAPLRERIAELEARDTLSLADSYRGSWQVNNRYARGSLVTHGGSCWLALEHAEGRPGSSPSWRLIVKAGKDAM